MLWLLPLALYLVVLAAYWIVPGRQRLTVLQNGRPVADALVYPFVGLANASLQVTDFRGQVTLRHSQEHKTLKIRMDRWEVTVTDFDSTVTTIDFRGPPEDPGNKVMVTRQSGIRGIMSSTRISTHSYTTSAPPQALR
ncbi:MAG: hypothetical protein NXI04_25475 [Planctomycetaceae bacterium]|nr:hypothetical protein [Planctomycetaceae bacterium]